MDLISYELFWLLLISITESYKEPHSWSCYNLSERKTAIKMFTET